MPTFRRTDDVADLPHTVTDSLLSQQRDALDRWAHRRLGKGVDALTLSDLRDGLAPLGGLSYLERSSGKPLGGRVAPHLRHVEEVEGMRLLRRADELLNEPKVRRVVTRRLRTRRRRPARSRRTRHAQA